GSGVLGRVQGLGETRREYIPVGLSPASLRATVSPRPCTRPSPPELRLRLAPAASTARHAPRQSSAAMSPALAAAMASLVQATALPRHTTHLLRSIAADDIRERSTMRNRLQCLACTRSVRT